MKKLKISVITPSFNQGEFIEETIESVLNQKYDTFEHIIIDGGSTDNTIEILKKYKHLKWVSEKDRGQSHALNKGFKKATGDIICWLNSDDTLCEGCFKAIVSHFQNNPNSYVVVGGLNFINKHSKIIKNLPPIAIDKNHLLNELGSVQQPSTFFKKEIFKKVGYIDESIYCCMDHDLFLRFLIKGYKFNITNQTLANFRIYQDTKTSQASAIFIKDKLKINRKYQGDFLNIYILKALLRLYIIIPIRNIKFIYLLYKKIKYYAKNRLWGKKWQ